MGKLLYVNLELEWDRLLVVLVTSQLAGQIKGVFLTSWANFGIDIKKSQKRQKYLLKLEMPSDTVMSSF